MSVVFIRTFGESDRLWGRAFISHRWGDTQVVVHGEVFYPHRLPGFVAESGGERVGLVTYDIRGAECEVITLDSTCPGKGIGTSLLEAVQMAAAAAGCHRLHVTTTNDNLDALHFYQKRGFRIANVHHNAVVAARDIKPAIPVVGAGGIPLTDEIELQMDLTLAPAW
jgi:ribosomal protein S18 acetylase RimI-like enzyme